MRFRVLAVVLTCAVLPAGLLISCSGSGNPILPENPAVNNSGEPDSGSGFPKSHTAGFQDDPVIHSILNDSENYAPDEVLVVFRDGIVPVNEDGRPMPSIRTQGLSILANHGLSPIRIIPTGWGTVYRLAIHDGTSVMDKVNELRGLPEIEIAEPNYKVYFCEAPYFPNDHFWENPSDDDEDPRSNVFEQFGPSKIGASVVWNDEKGSEDVIVCVLDTGVQWWHEDLNPIMWTNDDEIPDNGADDDGNGYPDDYWGWDTDQDDNDITEYNAGFSYHGTACSGVVAATQDNTVGCSGIAPGVRVMGVKCDLGGGSGYTSSVIEGVEYAADNGAHIISMSFRTYSDSESMHNTMDDAYSRGVLLVGGAGNEDDTDLTYPASWDCVIEVGGTSPFLPSPSYAPTDELRISFANGFGWGSNWGPHLEVMAFGEHYITTYGSHYSAYWDGVDDFFFGGTSNATPMVAAGLALLKSFHPGEDHIWLRERMRDTADDLYEPGFDYNSGHGRINLIRACYGADRFAAEEDPLGFVDMGLHENELYDSLNDVSSGAYIDTEDLYKITATENGYLLITLDIFTWGEDLDFEIYSDPSLDPAFLLDSQTGENHAGSSTESGGVACVNGATYYIRVFTAGLGESTAYGVKAESVENLINITNMGSPEPGTLRNGRENFPIGNVEFDSTFKVHLSEVIVSHGGTMTPDHITGLHLYKDSNGNDEYDQNDEHLGDATIGPTNRFVFEDLNAEIHFNESPMMIFLTIDFSGITEDGWFQLVLSSYKDISTAEGLEIPYTRFPITFGPFNVGYDPDPPVWDSTVGIQAADPRNESALLRWNSATDVLSPPVKYNVYWTETLPFNFGTANKVPDVSFWNGGTYDHEWLLTGLTNDENYFVAVRAEDQAGLEESNTVYIEVIPTMAGDPTAPQVIGSVNTPGSSWEVVVDPPNQRVFVADYNGGMLTIDVSAPGAPVVIDQVSEAEITGVDFDGTYVYAAGLNGMFVIDPDYPGGAEILGQVLIFDALDVCIVGNWAYVTDFGTSLIPVDVTIPDAPVEYPGVVSGNIGYGMDAQDGYLYVATNASPRVYNLADPSAPLFLTEFGGNGAYEVDAIGDRAYVTYWNGSRFSIYSLADPGNPQFMGYYQSNSGYGGADIVRLNGHIYFGTNDHYIEVINVDNWSNTYEVGQVSTDGPDGLDTDGVFVFSAENEHGLKVIL